MLARWETSDEIVHLYFVLSAVWNKVDSLSMFNRSVSIINAPKHCTPYWTSTTFTIAITECDSAVSIVTVTIVTGIVSNPLHDCHCVFVFLPSVSFYMFIYCWKWLLREYCCVCPPACMSVCLSVYLCGCVSSFMVVPMCWIVYIIWPHVDAE